MLFSFLLTPAVIWLERIRFPRALAVSCVVVVFVAAMGSVGWTVADQLVDVTNQLPNYRANIKNKIEALRSPTGQILNKATDAVVEFSQELAVASTGDSRTAKAGAPTSSAAPLSVRVVSPPTNWLEYAGSVLGHLGTAGIAIVFTIFILMRREDLRDRFIRLAGRGHLGLMTQALDDAAHRVSRYVFLEFVINSCYGLVVGVALHFIGIPHALLWGVGAGILRFLPYIGPPLGAALPILLSLAVFDGWTRALITIGLFVVIELSVSNFVEPNLYGAQTGISALAVLMAAFVKPVRTSIESPCQNGVAERWVESCRRDVLDHVIPLNEAHLKRLLSEYVHYYHEDRTHLGLGKQTPGNRRCSLGRGRVITFPRLGGLHHRYERAA
jgi:predicted PurR-regulated permease PerM